MQLIAFVYYDEENKEYVALTPDIEFCIAYAESAEEALETLIDIVEVTLEDEALPTNTHDLQYFTQELLKEMDIPLDASSHILTITEESELSYNVECMQ
ncbi:MAG: hypothetical protein JXQ67_05900 [Campylobacterales bacterium]|nr:hypothetical protein [Campylobacterales bacterium]